jgi:3-oxoacyl-[acyl-carrier protein] reductase
MSLTNKLFSLLGFAEPISLKRSNGTNPLPENVLLISTNEHLNKDINQALAQISINIIDNLDNVTPKNIEALIIDATHYINENSYQNLYINVQDSLKFLSLNARIILLANKACIKQSSEENAFSQSLVGFSKSLAKEVGRKGSTANLLLVPKNDQNDNANKSLISPINFFLSASSAFVSGQVLTIDSDSQFVDMLPSSEKRKNVAVVTGAAQGIGAAIASKLANDGYLVVGVDIEPMKAQLAKTMANLQGECFALDVSDKTAGEQLASLASNHGGFDLIVHNAGITRDKTLAKMPEHYWTQTLSINLFSVMRINEALFSTNSINTGGSIVCLSSMNGIAGQGGQTNYACSKAGIIGYVNSISDQLSEDSITINAVAPGFIETQMTEKMPFFTREMGRRMNALSQGGLPIDVAETVAFLGCKSSFGITGQTLRVCGLNIIGA